MNLQQFIKELETYLLGIENKQKIGEYLFLRQKNDFLFVQNEDTYLIQIGFSAKTHVPFLILSCAYEAQTAYFEYKMSHANFYFDAARGVVFWEDTYQISSFTKDILLEKMRNFGWQENPIFEAKTENIDYNQLILSILEWAVIRKNAIFNLLLAQKLDKKIKIEEMVSYTEEEKPEYQANTFPLNQILYGPSGTGKTYTTISKALEIVDNPFFLQNKGNEISLKKQYDLLISKGFISFVCFHQNYGYEDFIEGIKPEVAGKNLKFQQKDGIFKALCKRALQDTLQNFVLIIDEINRANISLVFGELMALLEDDKRWGNACQMTAILPSGEYFCIPKNVYIIGTMNTADKSISLIDIALRRRFSFEFMPPKYENFTDEKGIVFLKSLNQEILARKGKDFLIGHALFMKPDFNWQKALNQQIIPLLEEYFYTDKKSSSIKKFLDIACEEAGLDGKIIKNEWDSIVYEP